MRPSKAAQHIVSETQRCPTSCVFGEARASLQEKTRAKRRPARECSTSATKGQRMDGSISPKRLDLLTENPVYKPFRYPWAYEAWLTQQRVHWLPEEVPLADDVKDWHRNLSAAERNLLTQIFRFF